MRIEHSKIKFIDLFPKWDHLNKSGVALNFCILEDKSPFHEATDTPVFGLLWCLPWVSKARVVLFLRAYSPEVILRFTSDVTPADCIFVFLGTWHSVSEWPVNRFHLRICVPDFEPSLQPGSTVGRVPWERHNWRDNWLTLGTAPSIVRPLMSKCPVYKMNT